MAESGFYKLSAQEAVERLTSDAAAGLSTQEARTRLVRYGPNALVERGRRSPWSIIAEQLTSVLVVILIFAAAVSAGMGLYDYFHTGQGLDEIYDSIAIAVIIVLNTLLGFSQEYRAEKAIAALKKLSVPVVRASAAAKSWNFPPRSLYPAISCCWRPATSCPPIAGCWRR